LRLFATGKEGKGEEIRDKRKHLCRGGEKLSVPRKLSLIQFHGIAEKNKITSGKRLQMANLGNERRRK
jgi:hypothetical protein